VGRLALLGRPLCAARIHGRRGYLAALDTPRTSGRFALAAALVVAAWTIACARSRAEGTLVCDPVTGVTVHVTTSDGAHAVKCRVTGPRLQTTTIELGGSGDTGQLDDTGLAWEGVVPDVTCADIDDLGVRCHQWIPTR
jgi:hypothetical protein